MQITLRALASQETPALSLCSILTPAAPSGGASLATERLPIFPVQRLKKKNIKMVPVVTWEGRGGLARPEANSLSVASALYSVAIWNRLRY